MEKEKYCSTCKTWKPRTVEFFHLKEDTKDGFNYKCKECISEYNKQYRKKEKAGLTKGRVRKKHLHINFIKNFKYKKDTVYTIDALVRSNLVEDYFEGTLVQDTGLHVTFINKVGRRESFLKVDFLIGDYKIKEKETYF